MASMNGWQASAGVTHAPLLIRPILSPFSQRHTFLHLLCTIIDSFHSPAHAVSRPKRHLGSSVRRMWSGRPKLRTGIGFGRFRLAGRGITLPLLGRLEASSVESEVTYTVFTVKRGDEHQPAEAPCFAAAGSKKLPLRACRNPPSGIYMRLQVTLSCAAGICM